MQRTIVVHCTILHLFDQLCWRARLPTLSYTVDQMYYRARLLAVKYYTVLLIIFVAEQVCSPYVVRCWSAVFHSKVVHWSVLHWFDQLCCRSRFFTAQHRTDLINSCIAVFCTAPFDVWEDEKITGWIRWYSSHQSLDQSSRLHCQTWNKSI